MDGRRWAALARSGKTRPDGPECQARPSVIELIEQRTGADWERPLLSDEDFTSSAGGKIYVCLPCFNKRGLDENNLVDGAVVVGGAMLVAFMADGASSVSY